MKNNFVLLVVFCLFFVGVGIGTQSEVSITLTTKGIFIGTPANLNLGSVNPGDTVEINFDDYFWVEDLRGTNTGHYTTIQCDGLYGPSNFVITGLQLSGATVEMIDGRTNNTLIYSNLSDRTDITDPTLYLYRNNDVANNGAINRYGNKPAIKITVPSGVPAGSYKGKITYTLYDMSFNY